MEPQRFGIESRTWGTMVGYPIKSDLVAINEWGGETGTGGSSGDGRKEEVEGGITVSYV